MRITYVSGKAEDFRAIQQRTSGSSVRLEVYKFQPPVTWRKPDGLVGVIDTAHQNFVLKNDPEMADAMLEGRYRSYDTA